MRINIIIPNFNKEEFLAECIISCMKQTYDNYKIIFIDNESTDDSLNLAKETLSKFSGEYVIDTAVNIYPRCWDECLMEAFKHLDGEYYTIVGSDDLIDNNYLSNFANWIKLQKQKILCAQSDLVWVKNDGDNKLKAFNRTRHEYRNMEDLKAKMLDGCAVHTPSVFYNVDILKEEGIKSDPENYSGASDYDFYCQLLDKGIFIYNINDFIGYYYRVNDKQATWEMHRDPVSYDNLIQEKWKQKWKTS